MGCSRLNNYNTIHGCGCHTDLGKLSQYVTVVLPIHLVKNKNVLIQSMMDKEGVKYVIKWDYVLGEDITVPENCLIEFDGGSISNDDENTYTLTGQNTAIIAPPTKIFGLNVELAGTWKLDMAYAEWFGEEPSTPEIQKTIDTFNRWDLLTNTSYVINETINIKAWDWTNINSLVVQGHGYSRILCNTVLDKVFFIGGEATTETDDPRFITFSNIFITPTSEADNNISLFYAENGLAQCVFDRLFVRSIAKVWDFNKIDNSHDAVYWDIKYQHCRLGNFKYGFKCKRGFHNHFDSCYFGEPKDGGICIDIEGTSSTIFENCNFGGMNDSPMQFFVSNPNCFRTLFNRCNFEQGITLDSSIEKSLFYIYHGTDVIFDGCSFLFDTTGDGSMFGVNTSGSLTITNSRIDLYEEGNPAIIKSQYECQVEIDNYTKRWTRGVINNKRVPGNIICTIDGSHLVHENIGVWPKRKSTNELYFGSDVQMASIKSNATYVDSDGNFAGKPIVDGTSFWNCEKKKMYYWDDATKTFLPDVIMETDSIPSIEERNTGEHFLYTGSTNMQDFPIFFSKNYRNATCWATSDGYPVWTKKGSSSGRNNFQGMVNARFTVDDYGYMFYDFELRRWCVVNNFPHNDKDAEGNELAFDEIKIEDVVWLTLDGFSPAKRSGTFEQLPTAKKIIGYKNVNGDTVQQSDATHKVPVYADDGGQLLGAYDIGFSYYVTGVGKVLYAKSIDNIAGTVIWADALGNPLNTIYDAVAGSNTDNPVEDEEPTD